MREAHRARALACARRTARVELRYTHHQIGQQCHNCTVERALPGTHPPTHKPRSGGTASSSVWPWQCQQVACAAGAHLRHVCHAGIFRWKSEPHLCQSVAVRSASGLPKYSASVSASVSVSTTSSHSRGRGVGHTTRLREPPMADDAGDDLPPQAPGNGAGGAQAAPAMAAVVADEALNGFSFSGNAASCPACTPTLAVPSEPPLAHRQCLPRTTRSTVPWSHSCLRQRC